MLLKLSLAIKCFKSQEEKEVITLQGVITLQSFNISRTQRIREVCNGGFWLIPFMRALMICNRRPFAGVAPYFQIIN